MKLPSAVEIRQRLSERLFRANIVQNNFRGEVFEEIVNSAIGIEHGGDWRHCSADWNAWDFQCRDYFLQVKQAAARQSWDTDELAKAKGRGTFHIRPNSGYYGSEGWHGLSPQQRIAQIYVFGWHNGRTAKANHFDPKEWEFFVMLSHKLCLTQFSIGVAELERRALHTSIENLNTTLAKVLHDIPGDTPDWRRKLLSDLDRSQISEMENSTPPSPPATS